MNLSRMKPILPMLLFLCQQWCNAQEKVQLHPIVQTVQSTSLYSDRIDWTETNTTFNNLTQNATTTEGLKEGLQYLLNVLQDKHAVVRSTSDFSIVVHTQMASSNDQDDNRDSEFINTVINDITAKFSYRLLDNNIGYLRVVGIGPGDVKEQSDFIRQGLMNLSNQGANKWVLDLRYNGGGNVGPMLSGLAPLLGNGPVGGAVIAHEELIREYSIDKGTFNNNGRLTCEMSELPIVHDHKVAVLLSRYTASSGELTAIAFKGRKHTLFIGEPTAGYTTGNGYDPITDELALVISQDVFSDRTGRVYYDRVDVDIPISFNHRTDLVDDQQLDQAIL